MSKLLFVGLCAAGLMVPDAVAEQRCKDTPSLVGECFTVRGRLFAANGAPTMRIWRVGTQRILGVAGGETPLMPDSLRRQIDFDVRIYGDFEVCPFQESRPGRMQMVCIESGSRLVIQESRK